MQAGEGWCGTGPSGPASAPDHVAKGWGAVLQPLSLPWVAPAAKPPPERHTDNLPAALPQVPLQVLTERALSQHYYSQNKAALQAQGRLPADAPDLLAWDVSTSMYPHPTTDSINVGAPAY